MFFLDMIRADKYNAQADKINIEALNSLSNAEREMQDQQLKTMQSMEKLANRKKGILSTSIKEFIQLYEKIMTINFVESDGIKQLSEGNSTIKVVNDLRSMTVTAGFAMNSSQTISTYLVGTITGGLIGGFSNVIAKEAELNVGTAKMRREQASVSSSQAETLKVTLDAIFQQSERLAQLLAKLNLLFRKSIQNTEEIVYRNGKDRLNYSIEEKQRIRNCFNFADAIKKVLDAPLIDEEGQLTKKSIETIQLGEEFISKINNVNYKL